MNAQSDFNTRINVQLKTVPFQLAWLRSLSAWQNIEPQHMVSYAIMRYRGFLDATDFGNHYVAYRTDETGHHIATTFKRKAFEAPVKQGPALPLKIELSMQHHTELRALAIRLNVSEDMAMTMATNFLVAEACQKRLDAQMLSVDRDSRSSLRKMSDDQRATYRI